MSRKGFSSVAGLRGLLSIPAGTDEAAYERAAYVTVMRTADSGFRTW